jgi:hypothetical protein
MQEMARTAQENIARAMGPFVEALGPMQQYTALIQERMAQFATVLSESPALRDFARQQEAVRKSLDTLVRSESFQRFLEQIKAAEPPNWPEGRSSEVIELIERTRWPLVWAPDALTVERLLAAGEDDEALDAILVEDAHRIVEGCELRLDEIDATTFPDEIDGTREAIRAFSVAPKAAQAMAAITFESTLRRVLGYRSLANAAEALRAQQDWEDAPWPLYRWALIQSCLPDALSQFRPGTEDSVPIRFNRHATVHSLGPEQYRITNAVIGIVTLTAILREVDRLVEEGHLEPT